MAPRHTVRDTMQRLANEFITALEEGTANPAGWVAPWHRPEFFGGHRNVATGNRYTGGNALLLATAEMRGAQPWWGTYRQWSDLGAQVRKGEKAENYIVIFRPSRYITVDKSETVNGAGVDDAHELKKCSGYYAVKAVFHAGQVDGWEPPTLDGLTEGNPHDEADAAIAAWEHHAHIDWVVDNNAWFAPHEDILHLPTKNSYTHMDGYYTTVFHEFTHWTGHRDRLNRDINSGVVSTEARAFEELVAELGASALAATYGIEGNLRDDHRDYLANWLTALRNDPAHLWKAAGKAEKAAQFLLELATTTSYDKPTRTHALAV